MVHPMQRARQENINKVKEWLSDTKAKNPQNTVTYRERRVVIQRSMLELQCSERLAKEYVRIAQMMIAK